MPANALRRTPASRREDDELLRRAGSDLADVLTQLLKANQDFAKSSLKTRRRIMADVKTMMKGMPATDHGVLLTRLAFEAQRVLDERGSPKIVLGGPPSVPGGPSGGGIGACDGGVCAGVYASGSLSQGVTDGGFWASGSY